MRTTTATVKWRTPASAWAFCGLALFCAFVLPHLNRNFQAEEVTFPREIERLAAADLSPVITGVHPPIYVYLLAIGSWVSGGQPWGLRTVGLLTMLAAGLFVYLLTKQIVHEIASGDEERWVPLVSVGVFLVLPFTVQGALYVEVDHTLRLAASCGFVWAFLRYGTRESITTRDVMVIGAMYGLTLWCNLAAVPQPVFAVAVFYCLRGRPRRGIWLAAAIAAVGWMIFAGPYLLAGHVDWLQRMVGYPLAQLTGTRHTVVTPLSGGMVGSLLNVPRNLRGLIIWEWSLLLPALAIVVIRARTYIQARTGLAVDFVLLYALSLLCSIVVRAEAFPRFTAPAIPLFCVAVAMLLVEDTPRPARRFWRSPSFWVCLGAGILYYLYLGDTILRDESVRIEFLGGRIGLPRLLVGEIGILGLAVLPSAVAAVLLWRRLRIEKSLWHILGLASLPTLIAFSLALDLIQFHADYVTIWPYGERGMTSALDLVSADKSQSVLVIEHLTSYYSLTHRGQKTTCLQTLAPEYPSTQMLPSRIADAQFEWIVVPPMRSMYLAQILNAKAVRSALEADYDMLKKGGDFGFAVYRRTAGGLTPRPVPFGDNEAGSDCHYQ